MGRESTLRTTQIINERELNSDIANLGGHYFLHNKINQTIGWAFWDYYPQKPDLDRVYRYMEKYSLEWVIRERYKRNNTKINITMLETEIIAGEYLGVYTIREAKSIETMVHFGCASANAFWLAKKGLRGFYRIAELTHAGEAQQQKRRAKLIYKFCKDRYFWEGLK